MTDLQFRPALPGDADAVVPLIYESSQRLFDTLLKKDDPIGFLRHDFVRGDSMFGYRHQVVGVDNGQIVLTATLYSGRKYADLNKALMKSAATYFNPLKLVGLVARGRPLDKLFIEPRADALFIANGCVVAGRRSEGLFTQMLDHASDRARREGLAAVELDVSFSNDGARALYERVGFTVTLEKPYTGNAGFEGFRRMVRPVARAA
jgi:ribosomal protein S18 acetylase RimI-like enzyme